METVHHRQPLLLRDVLEEYFEEHHGYRARQVRQAIAAKLKEESERLEKLSELVTLIDESIGVLNTYSTKTREMLYTEGPRTDIVRRRQAHWQMVESHGRLLYLRSSGVLAYKVSSTIKGERWTQLFALTDLTIEKINAISERIKQLVAVANGSD